MDAYVLRPQHWILGKWWTRTSQLREWEALVVYVILGERDQPVAVAL
jgi:hypothetical protein